MEPLPEPDDPFHAHRRCIEIHHYVLQLKLWSFLIEIHRASFEIHRARFELHRARFELHQLQTNFQLQRARQRSNERTYSHSNAHSIVHNNTSGHCRVAVKPLTLCHPTIKDFQLSFIEDAFQTLAFKLEARGSCYW